jgi:methylmalonyl-CoA mutase N-terminal domain/subunit
MGGAVAGIESGYMQREIQEAAVRQQQEIEDGRRVVVGVNKFVTEEEQPPTIFRVDNERAKKQVERVRRLRAERDNEAVRASLVGLNEAARGDDNLMPPLLDAVKSYATLGEICGELRTVFGEYTPPTVV